MFKYVIIGKEVGENGTHHLQGYGEFASQVRFHRIKKEVNNQMHFERRYGPQKSAIDYCKKDGQFEEKGEASREGQLTDLLKIRDAIKSGTSYRTLFEEYELSASQMRVIDKYFSYLDKQRFGKTIIYWIHGSTGTGKSRFVYDSFVDIYKKKPGKWWDGYDRHKTCLLDDFRNYHMKFTDLLDLLYRYEYRVEVKGGFRQFDSDSIVIISNKHPKDYIQ